MVAADDARTRAIAAARAAADKKASEIIALDVSERLVLTDIFLVVSADNERQVRAVSDAVDQAMHQHGVKAHRKEGLSEARWVLLDYGDVVVHVQHEEDREYYALERLWRDCPSIAMPADLTAPSGDEVSSTGTQ